MDKYSTLVDTERSSAVIWVLWSSVTPAGHRVTIYWDAHRLVKGEDWEAGFSTGLLNSLCFFPLLSYGSTAPLAALPEDQYATRVAEGWGERPLGRLRLQGRESDWEDNVLKEFLIAQAITCQFSAIHAKKNATQLCEKRLGPNLPRLTEIRPFILGVYKLNQARLLLTLWLKFSFNSTG